MERTALLVLTLFAMALSKATIDDTMTIFRNTLAKWNVRVRDKRDFIERYNRLKKMKRSVDSTTTGVIMDTLNRFAVNNDEEHAVLMESTKRNANLTLAAMNAMEEDVMFSFEKRRTFSRNKRGAARDDGVVDWNNPPPSYDYYENVLGMSEPQDQGSCGACWAFPAVAAMEAVYKQITREDVVFSKQFLVDCTHSGSGCSGATIYAGFEITKDRQYLRSEQDWPYTAVYEPCNAELKANMEAGRKNAMRKAWLADWMPVRNNEKDFTQALSISPVAFGGYISENYFGYYQGLYEDDLCVTRPLGHAQLLVGYTPEYLRVRGSYGVLWGDYGYINYKRAVASLYYCKIFEHAYAVLFTERRQMEYKFCNNAKPTTRAGCRASCAAMNRPGSTGWTLATIPTVQHNEELVTMANNRWPGVKSDDRFNFLWIGLSDMKKTGNWENYKWEDPAFDFGYFNKSRNHDMINKFGLLNKNHGGWITKNNGGFIARGICSRARTCYDIGTNVENGGVEFSTNDPDNLVEGTTATVSCDAGCSPSEPVVTCRAGMWRAPDDSPHRPTCTCQAQVVEK